MWYIGQVRTVPYFQTFLILILISFAVLLLDNFKFLSLPKIALSYLTTPIQYGLYSSGQALGRQFHFIYEARFASQENRALKEQIGSLLSENANLRTDLAETESLLEQEQKLDPRIYKLLSARPIGVERFLKIDKGSADGVKKSQAVVFKDNYFGEVVNLSEKSADVRLPVDPDSKLSAFSINKEGKAKGILLGQFGQEMLFDKILHEEPIAEGDLVYSEGTEGFLPRGLILGRVSEVLQKENEVFKQAKVKPVFDIRDLELVFLIQE